MKKIIFAFAILLTLGAACKKEKVAETGTILLVNNSENPYKIFVNGSVEMESMPGKTTVDLSEKQFGYYNVRVLQLTGYLVSPTDKTYEATMNSENKRLVVSFP